MTSPQGTALADAVTAQYIAAQGNVRAGLLTWLDNLWSGLTSYRDADAALFVRQALPVVAGAQRATASLTAAYLGRVESVQTGTALRLPTVSPTSFVGDAVRQADPIDVYTRPFVTVWTDLSQGKDIDTAVKDGARRLQSIAATDVQLAKTNAAQAAMGQMRRVQFYRRVLSDTHQQVCGLCIVAATRRYRKADLMPIHPGCGCSVAPLGPGEDIGQVVGEDMLAAAHAAIADRFGKTSSAARQIGTETIGPKGKPLLYRDVLISHDHGEIGPVLAVRGQKFTGPREIGGHKR